MSTASRPTSARPFYLELSALGIDVRTGWVPELGLSCSEIARLMRRLRENRAGLREVLAAQDGDLEAIREEARS